MTIALAWWLVILSGTGVAVATTRWWPRAAAGVAVGTFALLVVAVAGAAPAREETVVRPFVAAAEARPEPPRAEPARRRAPPPSLTALVRRYYAALDRGDHRAAWRRLSPAVRAAFGGFATWRAGYATTVAHHVTELEPAGDEVGLVLVATDRTACGGTVTRRFRVRWRFAGRRAAALTATTLAGPDPATSC